MYLPQQQSSQVQQKQQSTVRDVLVMEINELKSRKKKLEASQQVQVSAIQLSPINIRVRFNITTGNFFISSRIQKDQSKNKSLFHA